MKPRISVVTLAVADLERAARFYEKGLGLPRKPMDAAADVAFFTSPVGSRLESALLGRAAGGEKARHREAEEASIDRAKTPSFSN